MKVEILQEELLGGLNMVLRAISTRVQLPVLTHILIKARKEGLTLEATDLEIGLRVNLAGKVETEGVVAAPGKMLAEFLGTLSPGKVEIELKERTLKLKSGGSAATFQTMDPTEFPTLPEFGGLMGEVAGDELGKTIGEVVFASARDSLRPVLTGVLVEFGKKMKLVATDGFRLAIGSTKIVGAEAGGEKETANMLIPARVVAEIVKLMQGEKIEVGYLSESKQVVFRSGEVLLLSQLLEGSFPDYQRILPKEFGTEVTVSREELLSAVRTSHVFARENSNMMKWEVGEGKIAITSSSPERGECRVEVAAKVEGEDVGVVFNAKYVMDYLAIQSSENLWIGLGGKLAPGMFHAPEEKNSLYVVMPINV